MVQDILEKMSAIKYCFIYIIWYDMAWVPLQGFINVCTLESCLLSNKSVPIFNHSISSQTFVQGNRQLTIVQKYLEPLWLFSDVLSESFPLTGEKRYQNP